MDQLKRIIGLAPSELPFEELVQKVSLEQQRVVRQLREMKAVPKAEKGRVGKKTLTRRKISGELKQLGVGVEEVLEFLKGLEEKCTE